VGTAKSREHSWLHHRLCRVSKNPYIRHSQGWINEVIEDLDQLVSRVVLAKANKSDMSIAYLGNVVDVWEKFDQENIQIDLVVTKHHCIIHGLVGTTLPELHLTKQ
jgi:urocanate hydratase